jgi:hypothetical protein
MVSVVQFIGRKCTAAQADVERGGTSVPDLVRAAQLRRDLPDVLEDRGEREGPRAALRLAHRAKFLVDRSGAVAARFEPGTAPTAPEVRKAIEAALG